MRPFVTSVTSAGVLVVQMMVSYEVRRRQLCRNGLERSHAFLDEDSLRDIKIVDFMPITLEA